eukprot:15365881-Ditylum_brightwellii.AAC.1
MSNANPSPGGGRGGRGGVRIKQEGGGRGRGNDRRLPRRLAPRTPAFTGKTDELKGHVYDVGNSLQASAFIRTTQELAEYAGRTCKSQPADIRLAIETLTETVIPVPSKNEEIGDKEVAEMILSREVEAYVKRKSAYQENKERMYAVAYGQCTESIRARLDSEATYETISTSSNLLGLLKLLRSICFNYQSQKYSFLAVHMAMRAFYLLHQKEGETVETYLENFQHHKDVVEHCGGSIGNHKGLNEEMLHAAGVADTSTATNEQKTKALTDAKEAYLAISFLASANRGRYGKLLEELHNDHLKGNGKYPITLVAAHKLLVNWQSDSRNHPRVVSNDGVAFAIDGDDGTPNEEGDESDAVLNSNGKVVDRNGNEVKCFICGKNHYANKCPDKDKAEGEKDVVSFTFGQDTWEDGGTPNGLMFCTITPETGSYNNGIRNILPQQVVLSQPNRNIVNPNWVLLDNQSTVDVFSNYKLLNNIREVDGQLEVHCNAGTNSTKEIGDFAGYGEVWYDPDGIANILSMARVREKYPV